MTDRSTFDNLFIVAFGHILKGTIEGSAVPKEGLEPREAMVEEAIKLADAAYRARCVYLERMK